MESRGYFRGRTLVVGLHLEKEIMKTLVHTVCHTKQCYVNIESETKAKRTCTTVGYIPLVAFLTSTALAITTRVAWEILG